MGTIRIERVLLGHLERRGMRRGDIALLVRAARASTTAHRTLANAAQATVTTTVPCPVGEDGRLVAGWTDEPVAVATIPLAGDYGWSAGELLDPRGTVPQTVALGALGTPSGRLFRHRDVDPDAILTTPRRENAVAAVPIETVAIGLPPFPIGRARLWWSMLLQRRSEKPSGNWTTTTFALASGVIGAATCTRIGFAPRTILTDIGTGTMALTWLTVTLLAIDSLTGRLLSEKAMRRMTSHEMVAAAKHRERMDAWQRERGFDDEGQPRT